MKQKSYTEKDIEVLTDNEHVRLRTQIYLGNMKPTSYQIPLIINNKLEIQNLTFIPAVYKAVNEVIDNSIDELTQIRSRNKTIKIIADPAYGNYTVSDNGRGVPIGKHASGVHTPQVVFGQLRSGRNFNEDDKQSGVIGQNGVGSSCVNMVSTDFNIEITRDNKKYKQSFEEGGTVITKPSIRKHVSNITGTSINFQLDDAVFEDISLPESLIENRIKEIALTNPKIQTIYNGKKYQFKNGFEDIINNISTNYFKFYIGGDPLLEFYVIFDHNKEIDEQIFTWVNSSYLFDGGICNTQFLNAFYDKTIRHLEKEAKKNKCEVTKNDIRQNLLIIGNLKVTDPTYDAQSKTRLTGPNLRRDIVGMIEENWGSFIKKNKEWLFTVIERSLIRHNTKANKDAIKDHSNKSTKHIPKLIDATNKRRDLCRLFVTEGDSAAFMLTDVRNPKIDASLPLSGKINNVYGSSVAKLLKMEKISNLLTAIGLVPGQKAIRSNLRYGKIIISTDSDYDGNDIYTLLVNLFYNWPELFDPNYPPFIYRLIAPNVCLVKGKTRVHFTSREDYDKRKNKYKGYQVKYFKGLGSMARQDWEMILSGKTDTLIPTIDDGHMAETLTLLFNDDSDARKIWLQENDGN